MKQCSKCRKQCDDSAAFCPYCGQKFGVQEAAPTGAEEVHRLRERAVNGDANAQYELGRCYQYGRRVTQSYNEALKWYQKAAKRNHTMAQFNLANCYYCGTGTTTSYSQAARWYQKAAEQGLATAQYYMGLFYEKGRGVKKNEAEAIRWYQKAADQGDEDAKKALGRLRNAPPVCPNCGRPQTGTGNFCVYCGTPLLAGSSRPSSPQPTERLCPTCGAKLQPGRVFCTNCGTKLAN